MPRGIAALRVLVAEDHPVNRQYMAALLEGMGHQTFFAGNGLEAVQALREQAFDIVLMDLHMPLLDGVGATLAIRALPDSVAATVPIIALTADAFAQTRERCLMAGMNDFLAKPVSPDKLSRHAAPAVRCRLCRRWPPRASAVPPAPSEAEPPDCSTASTLDAALRAMPRERLASHAVGASSTRAPRWCNACAWRCAKARRLTCASTPTRRAARR